MKLAFFYPSDRVRVPIDPAHLWDSPRGLTGSEGSCIHYALEMAKRGHDVSMITRVTQPALVQGVNFLPYEDWDQDQRGRCRELDWDACLSWMNPEPLMLAKPGTFRLFNQQCSDFGGCDPDWAKYVDIFCPLSNSHAHHLLKSAYHDTDKWRIMSNGVDTSVFKPGVKVPGKCIWASSHDRGLHWLLEAWPQIRAAVPFAELHVFYDFNGVEVFSRMEGCDPSTESGRNFNELGQRSRYVLEAIRRLKNHGVTTHQSVSRERIREEMATASVLPYPLDPIHYTETFGVTVLEACASGVIPVLCLADCFRELWGIVSECVDAPYPANKESFVAKVITVLMQSQEDATLCQDAAVAHARQYDWSVLVPLLEETIVSRGSRGLVRPGEAYQRERPSSVAPQLSPSIP